MNWLFKKNIKNFFQNLQLIKSKTVIHLFKKNKNNLFFE